MYGLRQPKPQVSQAHSIPAPVGGINDLDGVAVMGEEFAIDMMNFFPGNGAIDVRRGYREHVTGFLSPVQTIMEYNAVTGNYQIFAANNDAIYFINNSTGDALSTAVFAPVSNGLYDYVNFATAAGQYLVAVNGAEAVIYNGTTWTRMSQVTTPVNPGEVKGINPNLFTNVQVHKGRLWFLTAGSMTAWYLPIDSVGGEAKPFQLGGIYRRGGKLYSIERWSMDTGEGLDDRLLFITSAGEIASYSGNDPANAADWQLDSVYFVGPPIGQRAITNYGGDVLFFSRRGLLPLSSLIQGSIDQIIYSNVLTRRISRTVTELTATNTPHFPIEVNFHPTLSALILNIYDEAAFKPLQLVMNVLTGAWGKFDWPVRTIKTVDRSVFMATDDNRVLLVTASGFEDNVPRTQTSGGSPIEAYVFSSYSYMGDSTVNKHAKFMRPTFQTDVKPSFTMRSLPDFRTDKLFAQPPANPAKGNAKWDLSFWDQANWAGSENVYRPWVSANSLGYAFAWQMNVSTSSFLGIASVQWVTESGGLI